MKKQLTILCVGGGTVGHLLPLLVVMDELRKQAPAAVFHYAGSPQDVGSAVWESFPDLKVEKHVLESGKLHRFLTWDQVSQFKKMVLGFRSAAALVDTVKPDVVICKGGAVSVPVAYAAAKQSIPLFTHETDVAPGLANRLIAGKATAVFTAFPTAMYSRLPQEKLRYTGQPVRPSLYAKPALPTALDGKKIPAGRPLVAVVGGSQGGRRLNELAAANWPEWLKEGAVVQSCGERDYEALKQRASHLPDALAKNLFLQPFIGEELPGLLAHARCVITRSGGTIHELAALGAATVLVPLSTSAQNHQWKNAYVLTGQEAALAVDETANQAPEELGRAVALVMGDEALNQSLRKNIAPFAHKNAAQEISRIILESV